MAISTILLEKFQNKHSGKIVEAAVLVLIFKHQGEDHVLLTKRTEKVLHHKGQICFPGGARDAEDVTLWQTALRETEEEVGIAPGHIRRLTELSQQITPTGYLVTPYVAELVVDTLPELNPSPIEIDEVLLVPVTHLKNPDQVRVEKRVYEGVEFFDPHFTYEGHEIWGMTGRVLSEFLEFSGTFA